MNKLRNLVVLGLIILPFTAVLDGTLPPLYESAAEIAAIVKGSELGRTLPVGETIQEIHKNDKGYLIITPRYQMQVLIIYQHNSMPGPAKFEVEYQPAEKITISVDQ